MGAELGVQGRVQAGHVRVGDSQRNRLESRPKRKADGENQRTKGPSPGHPTLRGAGEMEDEAEKGVRRGSREGGGNQQGRHRRGRESWCIHAAWGQKDEG